MQACTSELGGVDLLIAASDREKKGEGEDEGEDEQEDKGDDGGGPADNQMGPRFVDLRKSVTGP